LRIEDPLRDVLKTCCSETPTDQHIIYNIHPGLSAPPKKNIHVLPKNVSPSSFPSPVC
jgi:hypothetical protein